MAGRPRFKHRKGRRPRRPRPERPKPVWEPKTRLGKEVKGGKITSFDEIKLRGKKLLESEIVDFFFPDIKTEFVLVGQSKGKFGGGARRMYKTTQKKVREGSRTKFTYVAIVGNEDGYIGLGKGASRESMPARERSVKNAKLNLIKIVRACGSWDCGCAKPHSIPFKVSGKCGSVRITLMPAPRGTGLAVHDEIKKFLRLAGVSDAWSVTKGELRSRLNLAYAVFAALKQTSEMSIPESFKKWGVK